MAYIPPHKRQSNPNPTPTFFPKNKTQNPNNPSRSKPYHKTPNPSGSIVSSPHSVFRWYHTSSETDHLTPVPYNCDELERNNDEKPLTLTGNDKAGPAKEEERRVLNGLVEKVVRDLEETSRHAREERENAAEREREKLMKLSVVARIGKVLFKGKDKAECISSVSSALTYEEEFNKRTHKTFYTNLSDEYLRNTEEFLELNCGFQLESEKDNYHVIVSDKDQPYSPISCKCIVSSDGNLELFKADVSDGINKLIRAAVINPEAKGGLTWPLGKESFSKRFFVTSFRHHKYKNLRREKIRVCLRHVDRFDQNASKGESSNEVTFKLKGVSELLTVIL